MTGETACSESLGRRRDGVSYVIHPVNLALTTLDSAYSSPIT